MSQTYIEPVFECGGIIFNNADIPRKCLRCDFMISAQSVHQESQHPKLCVETKIHFHKVYKNTGNCYYPGCKHKTPLEEIARFTFDEEFAYLVRKEDLMKLHEAPPR